LVKYGEAHKGESVRGGYPVMNSQEQTPFLQKLRAEALETDRNDLLAVLALRFGAVPEKMENQIAGIQDGARLERLVLVAANVPTFAEFQTELQQSIGSFKIVGEMYNPLSRMESQS